MAEFYFDIETYSPGGKPDPVNDKIISIQFQRIDLSTGNPHGDLVILKEWESSEENIIMGEGAEKPYYGFNAVKYLTFALTGVGIISITPGREFHYNKEEIKYLRLSYPHMSFDEIRKGVAILAKCIRQSIQ